MNRVLPGERYGRLAFVQMQPSRGAGKPRLAIWLCDCGAEKSIAVTRVKNGYSQSCGCLGAAVASASSRTHGLRYSREYTSWTAMKARCLNPNTKDYPRWGGRGVTICAEWVSSFDAFYAHLGPRPKNTSLDRIDNTKGYEPGNVRWATPSEQQRNRATAYRWHINGVEFETHSEAANHFDVSEHTIWRWVNGQRDNRRNSFTAPKENCYVVPRY